MATQITSCPIWGPEYRAEGFFHEATRTYHAEDSPRAGGGYVVSEVELNAKILRFDSRAKARLTTWLIDQRLQGNKQPIVTTEVLNFAVTKPELTVHERADRLLQHIASQSQKVGDETLLDEDSHDAYASSESVDWGEVAFYIKYLMDRGWLIGYQHGYTSFEVAVSIEGYSRISEQSSNIDPSRVFVAMWFGPRMDDAYLNGIAPAIEEAGFTPLRIDHKLDVEKIDDAIIAEIRRSRFLVADFTHGEKGVRGGVYFEAGFAMGLDIPVFFTCHSDIVEELHFDTRQYAHIVWSEPEDLRFALRDRILARIGHGPNNDEMTSLTERPARKPLGQWLVENVPRGTNFEPPSRNEQERSNAFLDEEA